MSIGDLDYLQTLCESECVEGGAFAYAQAQAIAFNQGAVASSLVVAQGDSVRISTRNSVRVSSGFINSSIAVASAVAVARTDYRVAVATDFAVDTHVSQNF